MNPSGAHRDTLPPPRRGDRHRPETHGRAPLPFHRAPEGAGHDLLVMNPNPDLTPPADPTVIALAKLEALLPAPETARPLWDL
jgi:hypothetical protein